MDENLIDQAVAEDNTTENVEVTEINISVEDVEQEISVEETTQEVVVELEDEVVIDMSESMGWVSGDNRYHDSLLGVDDPNQHPITAIAGLKEKLDSIEALKTVYSDKINVANFYEWKDATYDEYGYFVSLVPGASTIRVCDGADIFGVSVDVAGFVGGQDASLPRDESYGLIVTSGLVDVRCELDVIVGDCVVSNSKGYAKKSDSNYGYKVLARENKNGVEYAVIMLGVQADVTNALGLEVVGLDERLDAAESNIVSAVNVANQAYNKVSEIDISNKSMSDKINGAINIVDKVVADVENLSTQVSSSSMAAAQARAIAESAATSAESMKNEAVEKANDALVETSKLRKELEATIAEMNAELENSALELEATKESIEATRDELKANIDGVSAELENTKNDLNTTRDELSADIDNTNIELNNTREQLQSSIDSTSSELNKAKEELSETTSGFEELKDDLTPLIEWPDAENPTGVAGFVARANEDSATLSTIVAWQGETNDAIAAFKQEVADNYATIDSVTQLKTETTEAITNVKQTADDNKASIDLITSWQGDTNESLVKVSQKADDNEASIKDLVSWKDSASESISSIEQKTTKNEASINSLTAWQDEAKNAITNVEQKASDNEASITNLTAWQGTTNESIVKVEQKANDNESSIKALAQWQGEATQSIAKVEEKANANESNITLLTEWKSDVENDVESIASIKTQSDANKSSIDSLTSWQGTTNESLTSIKQQSDANKASIEAIAVWQGETEESIAVVKQQADDNEASIKTLTEWKDDTNESISSIEQRVDSAESNISSLTSWQGDAKTSIANVEQKSNANESKINSLTSWQSDATDSIAQVEQKANANESAITNLTTWQGETNKSIAAVKQTADQNSADISLITSWKSDVEDDVSSIASIKTTADENKAAIEQLVKKDSELSMTIAGVKTTADENKASIEHITSWQSKVDPTINSVAGIKQTADGNTAKIEGLTTWQGETNVAMACIEQKADANGAYIQSTVSNMDKYSVGPHSQAHGFTRKQVQSVLEEGVVYVPTNDGITEEYVGEGDLPTYKRTFSKHYLYRWGKVSDGYGWIAVDKNYSEDKLNTSAPSVFFSYTAKPTVAQCDTYGYWYTDGAMLTGTATEYEPYTLYKWDSYDTKDDAGNATTERCWIPVATLAGNSQSRAVSQIRQDANSIEMSVTAIDNKYAGTKAWVDENESAIQDTVTWANNNATVKAEANDNGSSVTISAYSKDANGSIAKTASLVLSSSEDDSSSLVISADNVNFEAENYTINASKIMLNGDTKFTSLLSDDQTTIDGGRIATGTLDASQITTGTLGSNEYSYTDGNTYTTNGTLFNLDTGELRSKSFAIDSDGNAYFNGELSAEAVNAINIDASQITTGKIDAKRIKVDDLTALGAKIGGWEINADGISKDHVGMSSGNNLTTSLLTNENAQSPIRFYAGYGKNDELYQDSKSFVCVDNTTTDGTIFERVYVQYNVPHTDGQIIEGSTKILSSYWEPEASDSYIDQGWWTVIEDNHYNTITFEIDRYGNERVGEHGVIIFTYEYRHENAHVPFRVLEDGSLYSSAAKIAGEISADSGNIGNLNIGSGGLAYLEGDEHVFSLNKLGLIFRKPGAYIKMGKDVDFTFDNTETIMKARGQLTLKGANDTQITLMRKTDGNTVQSDVFVWCQRDDQQNFKVWLTSTENCLYDTTVELEWQLVDEIWYSPGNYSRINGNVENFKFIGHNSVSDTKIIPAGTAADGIQFHKFNDTDWYWSNIVNNTTEPTAPVCKVGEIHQSISPNNIYITGNLVPSDSASSSGENGGGYNLGEIGSGYWNTIYVRTSQINISDRNQKNTIQPLSDAHGQIFDALKPVSYKFNQNNNNRTHTGLIAQDVKEAVENAGLTTQDFAGYCEWENEDGSTGCGLRYGEFISLCIDQIQKLKKRVEELEEKLNNTQ